MLQKQNRSIYLSDIVSMILLIMQTCGIRFFTGIGVTLLLLIIALNIRYLKKATTREIVWIIKILIIVITFFLLKQSDFKDILNYVFMFVAAFLLCLSYKNRIMSFQEVLFKTLYLFTAHAFLACIIYFLLPSSFFTTLSGWGMPYKTFYYLFYYVIEIGTGKVRVCGLLWEAGCLQFIANLYLACLILKKASLKKMLIPIVVILMTMSTNGYIIMVGLLCYYFFENNSSKRKILVYSVFAIVFVSIFAPIIYANLINKFDLTNTSGVIRFRDIQIGLTLLFEHPFLGVTDNLAEMPIVKRIEDNLWLATGNVDWIRHSGYLAGGYTNGLFHVFLIWGIVLGIIMLYYFTRSPFLYNIKIRFLFCFVYFTTLFSEPLTKTLLFILFVVSFMFFKIERKNGKY